MSAKFKAMANRPKVLCPRCGREISQNQRRRHETACAKKHAPLVRMTEDEENEIIDGLTDVSTCAEWNKAFEAEAKRRGFKYTSLSCQCEHEAGYGHDPRCGYAKRGG